MRFISGTYTSIYSLKKLGLWLTKEDLYIFLNGKVLIFFYVNNIIIIYYPNN